jgi:Zn finger protein HypA/HybF involved in hydrogenase expression
MSCHHCSAPVGDSPFMLVLSGSDEDWELPLCRSCQSMRQSGQLPVELLVQQWAFERSGSQAIATGELEMVVIQLDCLGCGGAFQPATSEAPGSILAQRMPDKTISTVCPTCHRTNVLARHGGQLVAVRLW